MNYEDEKQIQKRIMIYKGIDFSRECHSLMIEYPSPSQLSREISYFNDIIDISRKHQKYVKTLRYARNRMAFRIWQKCILFGIKFDIGGLHVTEEELFEFQNSYLRERGTPEEQMLFDIVFNREKLSDGDKFIIADYGNYKNVNYDIYFAIANSEDDGRLIFRIGTRKKKGEGLIKWDEKEFGDIMQMMFYANAKWFSGFTKDRNIGFKAQYNYMELRKFFQNMMNDKKPLPIIDRFCLLNNMYDNLSTKETLSRRWVGDVRDMYAFKIAMKAKRLECSIYELMQHCAFAIDGNISTVILQGADNYARNGLDDDELRPVIQHLVKMENLYIKAMLPEFN